MVNLPTTDKCKEAPLKWALITMIINQLPNAMQTEYLRNIGYGGDIGVSRFKYFPGRLYQKVSKKDLKVPKSTKKYQKYEKLAKSTKNYQKVSKNIKKLPKTQQKNNIFPGASKRLWQESCDATLSDFMLIGSVSTRAKRPLKGSYKPVKRP